ncbi:tetratricopeptide repeat protein [Treponema parvum]|uniref:Tetratricopeptide repeat protein n=1 Tax=Treponema parvum TaxID=138851 RepID=A0A975EYX6_9SPIR|nr:tetratricopeptide repeat protein [Treponema parvum]QTQ11327.1 tetratricopeptide repeat protein [Treponema parvum]QTQ16735.1 tetratricopeptide repeat protein [Treponema parvum]
MVNVKKYVSVALGALVLLACFPLGAQKVSAAAARQAVSQGLEAYRAKDWESAVFLLRKAVSLYENSDPDTLYILIVAEMYSKDYSGALSDSETFLDAHKNSSYVPYVNYQRGRALYHLGDYEASVMVLSDFCHENPENEMYSSALFWLAESFYVACRYDTARGLYERIITDFSEDPRAAEAQYRIEVIDQRLREEKLLYLLKKTGEEYLAAKENYEKNIKEYQAEGLAGLQRRLRSEQDKNAALSAEVENLKRKNSDLQNDVDTLNALSSSSKENPGILILKEKAEEIENLINPKNGR